MTNIFGQLATKLTWLESSEIIIYIHISRYLYIGTSKWMEKIQTWKCKVCIAMHFPPFARYCAKPFKMVANEARRESGPANSTSWISCSGNQKNICEYVIYHRNHRAFPETIFYKSLGGYFFVLPPLEDEDFAFALALALALLLRLGFSVSSSWGSSSSLHLLHP